MFKRRIPAVSGSKIDNIVGANTRFSGTLTSDGNLRIDGIYQGHIETTGNVVIGPAAKVLADIVANSVQVWGAVRGNITAKGRLEILPEGRVWGDVLVASLMVDEGGMFRGQCTMMGESAEPLRLPDVTMEPDTPATEAPPEPIVQEATYTEEQDGAGAEQADETAD